MAKQLQIGVELVPGAKKAGVLVNPSSAASIVLRRGAQAAADPLKIFVEAEVRSPSEIDPSFETLAREAVQIVVVHTDPMFRPEARCLRRHQARTAAPLRHRSCDRTHENRRSPRPLLPQGPCRRRRERRPYRSWLQLAPHPRLAEGLVVPHPDSAHTSLHDPVSAQISLLTGDYRFLTQPGFHAAQ